MTVRELIKKLQELDADDMEVQFWDEARGFTDILGVFINTPFDGQDAFVSLE